MGVLCFARRALTSSGCLGVYARKHTGRYLCVTFFSGVAPPAGTRVNKYSLDARSTPGQFVCYHLPHRTLLKIQGQDTSPFLQGIITNDMGLLEEAGLRAMYSHMLNVQGRTLYDIMLYRYSTRHNTVYTRLQLTRGCGHALIFVMQLFALVAWWHISNGRFHFAANDALLSTCFTLDKVKINDFLVLS